MLAQIESEAFWTGIHVKSITPPADNLLESKPLASQYCLWNLETGRVVNPPRRDWTRCHIKTSRPLNVAQSASCPCTPQLWASSPTRLELLLEEEHAQHARERSNNASEVALIGRGKLKLWQSRCCRGESAGSDHPLLIIMNYLCLGEGSLVKYNVWGLSVVRGC